MRKIIKGSYTDYFFLFGDERTAYTNLVAKNAAGEKGSLYILMEGDRPMGYLALLQETSERRILYVHTLKAARRQGVCTELMRYAIRSANGSYRVNIAEEQAFFSVIRKVCERLGFHQAESCLVFGTSKERDFSNWERFMKEKGERICRLLRGRGYEVYSFRKAPAEAMEDLRNSCENYYHNSLPVKPFLENEARGMDPDMSFLTIKKNRLAAYSLVSRPDQKSVIFEHISVSEAFLGSGCIFLPFAASMQMFPVMKCERAAYTMYDDNDGANAFRRDLLARVTTSEKRYCNFVYRS